MAEDEAAFTGRLEPAVAVEPWYLKGYGVAPAAADEMKSDRSIRAILGVNVRRLRERQGWSREGLAHRLGISVAKIAAIECGDVPGVRIGVVEAIARLFKVTVAELLTLPGKRRKPRSKQRLRTT